MASIYETVVLTTINCGVCGATYAINEAFRVKRQNQGGGWNCPYCRSNWGYFGETELQRAEKASKRAHELLAQQRAETLHQCELREAAERRAAAARGQVTRIKNRVGNGVCPCCNRSFQNLHRHMSSQHPDFTTNAEDRR